MGPRGEAAWREGASQAAQQESQSVQQPADFLTRGENCHPPACLLPLTGAAMACECPLHVFYWFPDEGLLSKTGRWETDAKLSAKK